MAYTLQPEEIKWNLDSLARVVQPMSCPLRGRLPLLLWNIPLPRGPELLQMREDGTLRHVVDMLAERGLVVPVRVDEKGVTPGAIALAQTLHETGQPVQILVPIANLLETGCYSASTLLASGRDPSVLGKIKGKTRRWPCLPRANSRPAIERVHNLLLPFRQAGITVGAVWFSDESLPNPWNGIYESQLRSAACRRSYPPGTLDDMETFSEYIYRLRTRLCGEVMADTVHALFPGAITGNFTDIVSTPSRAAIEFNGVIAPPRSLGRMDVMMPQAYANTYLLPDYFLPDWAINQRRVDEVYLYVMLRAISSANANKPPRTLSIPYVSRFVRDDRSPRFNYGLSPDLYRELLRHLFLRGSDSLFLFNLGFPGSGVTAAQSLESVEDARSVYDELLHNREFLTRGTPMTYDVPAMPIQSPLWSGVRLGDRCLVRTFSPGGVTTAIDIVPFTGVAVKLEAPPEGATYLIRSDGVVERMEGKQSTATTTKKTDGA